MYLLGHLFPMQCIMSSSRSHFSSCIIVWDPNLPSLVVNTILFLLMTTLVLLGLSIRRIGVNFFSIYLSMLHHYNQYSVFCNIKTFQSNTFQSNFDTEYMSRSFRNFLLDWDTLRHLSCSIVYVHNRVAEYKHHHILKTARSLLIYG